MRGADPLPLRSASPTGIAATEAALRRSLEAKEGTERFYLTELRRAAVCYNGVLQTFEQAERLEGRAAHDSSERRSLSASRESTRRLYPFTDTGRPRLPLTNCGTRCSPSHRRSTGTGTAESAGCFNALHLPLRGSATSSLRSLSPMAPPLASSVSAVTPSCASSDASMLYFDDLVSRAKMLRRARREPPPQPPAECSAAPSRRPVEAAPTAAGRTNSCLLRAQQPQEQDSLPLSPASAAAAVMDAGRKSPAAGGRPAARPWRQQADREPTELSGSSAAAGRAEEAVAWPRDGNANEELYNGEHPATPRVVGGAERRDRAGETDPSRGVSKPAAPESSSASSGRRGSRLEEAGVTEMTRESPVRGDASVQSWRLRAGRWHCEPAVAPGKVAEVAEAPSPAEWPFTAPSFRSGAAAPRHAALASPTPDSSDRSASASVSCASAAAAVMDAGRKSPAAGGRPAARPWHQQADREPTELSGSSAAAGRAEEAVAWPRDGNANEELYNGEHPATPRVVGGAERRDRAGETDPSRGVSKPAAPESSSASSGSRLEEAGVTEMTRESPVRGDASVQSWRLRAGRWHCEPAVAPGKVAEVAEAPSPAEWPSTAPSFRSGAAAPRHAALASPTPDSSDRSASASVSCASAAAAVMDAGRKSPAAGGRPAARPWRQQADREPTELSGSSAAAGRAEEAVAWPRDGNANEELYNGEHPATPRVVGGAERRDRAGETDPSRGVSKPAAPESSSASSGSRLEEAGVTERTRESPVRGDASVQSWRLRAGRWHCEPAVAPGKVAEVAEAPSPAEWPSTAPSFRSGAAAPRHAALASPTPDSSDRSASASVSCASAVAAVMDAGRKSPAAGGRPAARPWRQQADREPTELSGSSAAAGRAEEAVAWPRDGNANEELYNGEHPATPRVVGGAERRDRAGETDPSRGVSKPAAPESSSASSGSRLEEAGVTERTRESPVRGDASVQSWRLRAGRWHCEPAVAPGKVAEVAEAPSPAEWPSTAPSFHSGAAAPRLAALASPTPDSSSRGTSEEGSWKKGMASVLAGEAVSLRPLPVEKDVLFGWQALLAKVKGEYPVDAGAAEPRTSSYRRSEWMELNRSRSPGPRNSGEAEPAVEVRDGDTSGVTEIHYHYHISLGAESHPAPALSIASSALRRLERFETAQRAAVVTAWIIGFTALAQASAAVAPMHRRPPEQLRERRGSSDGSVADAAQASHHRSGPEPLTEPDGAPMQETRAPAPARGDSTAPAPASLAPLAVLTSDTLFATVDRALRVHPRVGCPYPFRPGDLLVAIEGRTVLFLEEVATWEAHLDWARYDEQYVTVTRSRPARPGRRSASRAATVRSLDGRRCAVHIKIQPPFLLLP